MLPWPSVALLTLSLAVTAPAAPSPGRPPCSAPEYHAFDFWLGSWNIDQEIIQTDGTYIHLPAENRVETAVGGCALVEHWRGLVQFSWEGMTAPDSLYGLSVRSYDPQSKAWSIYWLGSRHPSFGRPFVGGFEDGRGTFEQHGQRPDGTATLSRIVFEPVSADTVEWHLDTTRDGGAIWTPVWKMHFHRAAG